MWRNPRTVAPNPVTPLLHHRYSSVLSWDRRGVGSPADALAPSRKETSMRSASAFLAHLGAPSIAFVLLATPSTTLLSQTEAAASYHIVRDLKLGGVEHELADGRADIEVDGFRAGERQLVDVGLDPDRIVSRRDLFWQFAGRACEIEWFLCRHICGKEKQNRPKNKEASHAALNNERGRLHQQW